MKDIKALLTEVLNKSENKPQSILISGRTGTGKTTIVNEWFKEHPEVDKNILNANMRSRAYNNIQEADGSITQLDFDYYFYPDEIDNLNKDGIVLFIDHFDLTHDDARKHLLDLVRNRKAIYNLNGEVKHLDKLKMIIAVSFEKGEGHFGYKPLNDEDINAFDYVVNMSE